MVILRAFLTVLLCAAPVSAQFLVVPGEGQSLHSRQAELSGSPPHTGFKLDVFTGPRLSASGSSGTIGNIPTEFAQSAANYTNEVFRFGFPFPTEENAIRLSGSAAAQAVRSSATRSVGGAGSSLSSVTFTVEDPVLFTLSGAVRILAAEGVGAGGGVASAGMRLSVTNAPVTTYLFDENLGLFEPGVINLTGSGTLLPGLYTLRGYAAAQAIAGEPGASWLADAEYDFRIEFAPVPSPGALAIAPLAMLAVCRRRRR